MYVILPLSAVCLTLVYTVTKKWISFKAPAFAGFMAAVAAPTWQTQSNWMTSITHHFNRHCAWTTTTGPWKRRRSHCYYEKRFKKDHKMQVLLMYTNISNRLQEEPTHSLNVNFFLDRNGPLTRTECSIKM